MHENENISIDNKDQFNSFTESWFFFKVYIFIILVLYYSALQQNPITAFSILLQIWWWRLKQAKAFKKSKPHCKRKSYIK